MTLRTRTAVLLCVPALALPLLGAAPAAAAQSPRPGCGFGDDNHSHPAAPGRDR